MYTDLQSAAEPLRQLAAYGLILRLAIMRAGFNGDFGAVGLRANAVQWAVARAHGLWH